MILDYEYYLTKSADLDCQGAAGDYDTPEWIESPLAAGNTGPNFAAPGAPRWYFYILVTEGFAGGTSGALKLMTDTVSDLSDAPAAVMQSAAIPTASLGLGARFYGALDPSANWQPFLRGRVTTVGSDMTAGKVSMFLTPNLNAWKAGASALSFYASA